MFLRLYDFDVKECGPLLLHLRLTLAITKYMSNLNLYPNFILILILILTLNNNLSLKTLTHFVGVSMAF